mmetsp:Transcript_1509/g.5192  ORF Transcript_1509/g.5192 Transcript_1509/m.5192 type:complete len:208 (+) Transcript_1509:274-897(+)
MNGGTEVSKCLVFFDFLRRDLRGLVLLLWLSLVPSLARDADDEGNTQGEDGDGGDDDGGDDEAGVVGALLLVALRVRGRRRGVVDEGAVVAEEFVGSVDVRAGCEEVGGLCSGGIDVDVPEELERVREAPEDRREVEKEGVGFREAPFEPVVGAACALVVEDWHRRRHRRPGEGDVGRREGTGEDCHVGLCCEGRQLGCGQPRRPGG